MMDKPVLDTLSRPLEALRISVTDRCNLRCTYCMPKAVFAGHKFLEKSQLLTFEEIELLAEVFIALGVRKIRLTGGEPLLRSNIADLIRKLVVLPGLAELALSTNALLLGSHAEELRAAGLSRLNISLDAIDDSVFGAMNGLGTPARQVLGGIDHARSLGFALKVNMVVQRGANEGQIVPMARHFAERGIPLRFIEFMDVGNSNRWNREAVVSGQEIRAMLRGDFSLELRPGAAADTERRYDCARTGAQFGFIESVTAPFCRDCNRLRLSADGRLFTCLFATLGHDIGRLVRERRDHSEIAQVVRGVWQSREDRYSEIRATHPITESKPEMSYIGG
jgi:cyclic pyranopterin phosphate synthase